MDLEAIKKAYIAWLRSPPFDIGDTTSKALSKGNSEENTFKNIFTASQALNRDS